LETAFLTHTGKVREHNEDSCFIKDYGSFLVAAVADGMGGHNAGEVASLCAVTGVSDFAEENDMCENTEEKLSECVKKVNYEIYRKAVTTHGLIGMGTTLTVAVIYSGKVYIAHVGDTRAYVYSDSLNQITNDHSYVEELYRMGRITKEEAKEHPGRNQLTRAVGTEDEVKVDTYVADIKEGDILLLTSDGLTNMVDDEEIAEILNESENIPMACAQLVEAANYNGGSDNITAALIKY